MKKHSVFLLLLLLALLLIGGCAEKQGDVQPNAEERIYLIKYGNSSRIVNGKGELLLTNGSNLGIIYEAGSGKPAFLVNYRAESQGAANEWGMPQDYQYFTQLYDLAGNLLHDWQPVKYELAWKEFLFAFDYSTAGEPFGCLISSESWQQVYRDIQYPTVLGEYLWVSSNDGSLSVLLDAKGSEHDLPHELNYAYMHDSHYIVARSQQGKLGIYDAKWRLVVPFEYDSLNSLVNGYVTVETSRYDAEGNYFENSSVIKLSNGKTVLKADELYIDYCDGELVLIRKDGDSRSYYLADMQLTQLSESYDYLYAYTYTGEYEELPQYFVGSKGESEFIIDRKGNELFSSDEDESISQISANVFTVRNFTSGSCKVINAHGEVLFENDYGWLNRIHNIQRESTVDGYLLASRTTAQGMWLKDLIDLSGKVIVGNMKSYLSFDGQVVVCCKGFSVGLIGLDGEWIYEESVFNFIGE